MPLVSGLRRVRTLHMCVPGRVRVHVTGLKECAATQRTLRSTLAHERGVTSVTISALTGNVTILFAKEINSKSILERIRLCLEAGFPPLRKSDDTGWETLSVEEAASRLDTSLDNGLSYKKAARLLREHGRNELVAEPPRSRLDILLEQFSGAPVVILLGAGLYSLCIGAIIEAAAVGAVLAINAAIGYVTESKAEATVAKLARTGAPRASVCRDGGIVPLDASLLVPGDTICLERGDLIPADARLVEAEGHSVRSIELSH